MTEENKKMAEENKKMAIELIKLFIDQIKDSVTDETYMMKLFVDTFTSYLAVESNINFRYRDNKKDICLMCEKVILYDEICRTPGVSLDTCQHLFHANCICKYLNENKVQNCKFCNKKVEQKV